jgi:ATPase subunit of ABC transporter with duplicated ATPase domains
MLKAFVGTLVIVTHDVALLRSTVDELWHINNGRVRTFSGNYDDYVREVSTQQKVIDMELADLSRQKRQVHESLMQEQSRAKSSRAQGEKNIQQRKWPTIVSDSKARNAQETSGRKKRGLHQKKQEVMVRWSELYVPERIQVTFSLQGMTNHQTIVSVADGQVGYETESRVLRDLRFSIQSGDRIALEGRNGSGKSTLVKAILGDRGIIIDGDWIRPKAHEIGYLDQHYKTLNPDKTVLETIRYLLPDYKDAEIRKHLNDFLFRKNEEVNALIASLSGGEKVRLSLAQIAAKTPKLLILDEMTNNLDLETRAYVIEVLKEYPGALLVISHDVDFLKAINLENRYQIENGCLSLIV